MTNVFGFSTETSSSDFMAIIKYDSRSGRIFRIDRVQGADGFISEPVDITQIFKAVADFENIETGWIAFSANSAPSFVLVPIGTIQPPKPTDAHKNGVRFMLKLTKACGGDRQLREIAGVAKSFLAGVEEIYLQYTREKAKYPGQLPVIVMTTATPVTTGSGVTKSTNYRPSFKISGWAKRPDDLIHSPATALPGTVTNGSGEAPWDTAPSTGGRTVPPPNSFQQGKPVLEDNTNLDDFG